MFLFNVGYDRLNHKWFNIKIIFFLNYQIKPFKRNKVQKT